MTHSFRYENERRDGKFTHVWRGTWSHRGSKTEVAIKQLQRKHQTTKLADFSQLSYDVLVWDDPTLVKAFGVCLATRSSPMVLVQEYFEWGPLDKYLQVRN